MVLGFRFIEIARCVAFHARRLSYLLENCFMRLKKRSGFLL